MTLVFHWPGRNSAAAPILLLAHQDVVPVDRGTEMDWTYPAFAGVRADGYIWGRGALDDKASMMVILEVTERLLSLGFQPPRDVWLAFGHDEEVGGRDGAAQVATIIQAKELRFALVLNEGGIVLDGFAGTDGMTAFVGIGEKGIFCR